MSEHNDEEILEPTEEQESANSAAAAEDTNTTKTADEVEVDAESGATMQHSGYKVPALNDETTKHHLGGMYQTWFLDFASEVNLDRAIPHIDDGLIPVQRRVLHSMNRMEDGRMNKVANIVGHTMQFHPHGDSAIYGALVNLGQKRLLVDTQGNWGNILTGDGAAAGRYIEGRLSKFALEAIFNPKTTQWRNSYDGRNKEPIYLPAKFPLLLSQGAQGIGLGLNCRILPHNFNELIEAAIAYLRGEEFRLYPDFPTAGSIDVSEYNDGQRGGRVKIRCHIEKLDPKTLVITDVPYGVTTDQLQESIVKANEKGKINIRKVEELTTSKVEVVVTLAPNTSSDKTIDALYAFTLCEQSISPNCCVIENNKPIFTNVTYVLKHSVDTTKNLLRQEQEIKRNELLEQLHFCSLEKIFIEERIYKDEEYEKAKDIEVALKHIAKRLEPFKESFVREVTHDDLLKLEEIKMSRIHKFSADTANDKIAAIKKGIKECEHNIKHIVDFTIAWFEHLKEKYGKDRERLTEIKNFENIDVVKVVEANEKLYINREEGFIGTGLKKDEFVCNCSNLDDIIVFFKDGKYMVVKVEDKKFVGKNVIHIDVFKKNDQRTIYNVVYRDGKTGISFIKRCAVSGVTREKVYDLTQGTTNSRIYYFTANKNGEAETIRVALKPTTRRIKNLVFEMDFSTIAIKGRQSRGNILTKFDVSKITLKSKGVSTLGGTHIYFDRDILRLNTDKHGDYLGEFLPNEEILVLCKNGDYYTTTFDLGNHYDEGILRIEKFNPSKVWTVALFDADQGGMAYLKRFQLEVTRRRISMLGNPKSTLITITDTAYPRLEVVYGGAAADREPLIIDADEFIGIKSVNAKGKRLTTFVVDHINELEPTRFPEPEPQVENSNPNDGDNDNDEPIVEDTQPTPPPTLSEGTPSPTVEEIKVDEETGQTSLFFNIDN